MVLVVGMCERVVVVCAGQPGSERDEYLQELNEKREFFYYHLFDYIVEEASRDGYVLSKLNVLDFYDSKPDKLEAFRAQAIRRIIEEIKERNGVHIISTPFHFEWKGKSYKGLREDEVKALNPDLFLLIIDDLIRVRERLKMDDQWRDHNFTLVELAQWRREEIMGVHSLSHGFVPHKEFYLAAREHGVGLLEDLVFNRHKKKVYLSHPITGESEDFFEEVSRFAHHLRPYYTVFDPSMIKDWAIVEAWRQVRNETRGKREMPRKIKVRIEYSDGLKEYEIDAWDIEAAIKNIRAQIIDIDYRIIESCYCVVAYHSREQISTGVICEMVEAKSLAKFVYVYYPFEPSPFFEWYSTKIFVEEEKILDFLKSTVQNNTSH